MVKSPKIDIIIIGAQKAGTTSLKRYLGEHPGITTHEHKEFSFFADHHEYLKGYDKIFSKYFGRANQNGDTIILCKHATLYKREESIRRLYKHNPKCRIVFVLRNPADRAYSAYLMGLTDGWIHKPFESIVDMLCNKELEVDTSYYKYLFKLGIYHEAIDNLKMYFPPKQIKIILYEDLVNDSQQVCQNIFNYLGIDDGFEPDVSKRYNVTKKVRSRSYARFVNRLQRRRNIIKIFIRSILPVRLFIKFSYSIKLANKTNEDHTAMTSAVHQKLVDFYKPHNQKLEELLGCDLSHWDEIRNN